MNNTFLTLRMPAGKWAKVWLPYGKEGYVADGLLTSAPLSKATQKKELFIFERPVAQSPVKENVPTGNAVIIYGYWREYALVGEGRLKGWTRL